MAQSTHPGCPSCFPVVKLWSKEMHTLCLYDIRNSALHVCRGSALVHGSPRLGPARPWDRGTGNKVLSQSTYKHASQHGIPFYSLSHCIHTRLVWISLLLLLYSVYSPAPIVHYCIYNFVLSALSSTFNLPPHHTPPSSKQEHESPVIFQYIFSRYTLNHFDTLSIAHITHFSTTNYDV